MNRWTLAAAVLIVLLHCSVGDDACYGFVDTSGAYQPPKQCPPHAFCCGDCNKRFCCNDTSQSLNEDTSCQSGATCNMYMDKAGYFKPQTRCPPNYFCCGTCDSRVCCTSSTATLDQSKCPATPSDTCVFYTDSSGDVQPAQHCAAGEYCCGKCNNRYCCTSFSESLNQIGCHESEETCSPYVDSAGKVQAAQTCSQVQYCCGTCNNRSCCSDFALRMKQDTCPGELCGAFIDDYGAYQRMQYCSVETSQPFCCGSCNGRYCCAFPGARLEQDSCDVPESVTPGHIAGIIVGVVTFIAIVIVVFCFLCACCCFSGRRQITQLTSFANKGFSNNRDTSPADASAE